MKYDAKSNWNSLIQKSTDRLKVHGFWRKKLDTTFTFISDLNTTSPITVQFVAFETHKIPFNNKNISKIAMVKVGLSYLKSLSKKMKMDKKI